MTATLRRRRWLTGALGAAAVGLVPWTLWLGLSLPGNEVAHHYNVAWSGFDLALAAGIAATAWSAMHRTRWLVPLASATATMLLCDAWFDVVTSPAGERLEAVLLAGLAELPLAAVCAAVVVELRRG